ncbi:hypothetical protein V8E51_000148 [Hyaloscypha variabilis]
MSQQPRRRELHQNRQEESVPRPPHATISPQQAQDLINSLLRARHDYVGLEIQSPAGHPLIRTVLREFPDVNLDNFERLLVDARKLLDSALATEGRHCPRQKASNDCSHHKRIERQVERIKDELKDLGRELGREEYDHIRRGDRDRDRDVYRGSATSRQQGGASHQMEPAEPSYRSTAPAKRSRQMEPDEEEYRQMAPARRRSHQTDLAQEYNRQIAPPPAPSRQEPSQPPSRRTGPPSFYDPRPSYQDLLIENRMLQRENVDLKKDIADAKEEAFDAKQEVEEMGRIITEQQRHVQLLDNMLQQEQKDNAKLRKEKEKGGEDEE